MSETTNYQLYITDNESEHFKVWREKMNGTNDSNMIKIDAALSSKANNSVVINATLFASAWVGDDAPYIQTVTITGLTPTQNGVINISQNATSEQREIVRDAIISVIGQENDTLIVASDGVLPKVDIPVCVILLD